MADRDENVYRAKLAEQAERYDEMVDAMRDVAKMTGELNMEERNLLSVAYKNVIGSRRASWRIMSSIEQKAEQKDPSRLPLIKAYRSQIEKELKEVCADIIALLDESLLVAANGGEAKVFFLKMKGGVPFQICPGRILTRSIDERLSEILNLNPATHPPSPTRRSHKTAAPALAPPKG